MNCPNFKFKAEIIDTNTPFGNNDMFEVYTSIIDNKIYIASPNYKENYLDIYSLLDNKKITSLKDNNKSFDSVRYFVNYRNKKEYLVTGMNYDKINIWDITDNYKIKYKIDDDSCILIFIDNDQDYIITGTKYASKNKINSTKIYSFNNCSFIRYIENTNQEHIEYLLPWLNKKDQKYYIIQLAKDIILINDLKGQLYANLSNYEFGKYYTGFLYSKDNKDYLCVSSEEEKNSIIEIWDLDNKNMTKVFDLLSKFYISNIISWNERYILICDCDNKCIKVFDLENEKVISLIKGEEKYIKSIKKLNHPTYGKSILTADKNNRIKLWVL